MKKRRLSNVFWPLGAVVLLAICLSACKPEAASETEATPVAKQPNIIFILVDDMGYGDLGVLFQNQRKAEGKPYHSTPELDKMAAEGAVLTRHYVPAPVCAPSRASLLSGLHQGHQPIRNNQFDKALANNHNLASVLQTAGYTTAIVGKYGLQGKEGNTPAEWEAYPTKRGFDYFFGYVRHVDGHNHYPAHEAPKRPPMELYENEREISQQLKGCYTTDLFTGVAKKWIVEQRSEKPEKPFFLYLSYNTPHAGLQVAPGPYPDGKGLNGGVQVLESGEYFLNAAAEPVDSFIHPDYRQDDWPITQQRFASMMRRIDEGIGDLLQLLKDLEIDEQTLVVFTSDNGPHHESYGYGEYEPAFFESYGNLDGTKRDTWEGGIRVPTLVRWASQIGAGQYINTPSGFHDWLPTLADLAGVPAPANTDGVSLRPSLTGQGEQLPSSIYIEYSVNMPTKNYASFQENRRGISRGEMQVVYYQGYKGVRYNITSHADNFEIYDTQVDPGERNNLAGSSAVFEAVQQGMKDRALQMRMPDVEAPRPYDDVPVPAALALNQTGTKPGLEYALYDVETAWVPDVRTLSVPATKSGIAGGLAKAITSQAAVTYIGGLLKVPVTGTYTFKFSGNGHAVMRLNEALVFDADKGYTPATEKTVAVRLAEGYHRMDFTFLAKASIPPSAELSWGQGAQPNDWEPLDAYFFHIE